MSLRFHSLVKRKAVRLAAAAFLLFALLALAGWIVAPYCVNDPMVRLRQITPTHTYLDRNGIPVFYETTHDYEWRFPVELDDIAPEAVSIMLSAEDYAFYEHGGVDYHAILRALWQDIKNAKIISGASTITMQLAGFALVDHRPSLVRKFKQAAMARRLEQLYTKDEILTEYLNRIPCGGKVYGIEAAARFYFGLHASQLNRAEAALLCGIPQKPNRYKPNAHPEAAKKRQKIVLDLLAHHELITADEAHAIYDSEPLRYRDFTQPADFEFKAAPDETIHAVRRARAEKKIEGWSPSQGEPVLCSIDADFQRDIQAILKRRRDTLPGVRDAAAVVLDNASGEVLVFLGTLDFSEEDDGQYNAANAVRSAGSTLKPFLYAEAVEGGLITADTRVLDAPLRYGDYAPGNFDGAYRGTVKASYALSYSLNTPAIRLAATLGESRMIELADKLHILASDRPRSGFGLSMALGSAGHTLLSLTNAYRALATDGKLRPVYFRHDPGRALPPGERIFSVGTVQTVMRMLTSLPLTGFEGTAAWKTGTSNNLRDAWCFACTETLTVGVWFGNKDGSASESLVGGTAAAPAAGEILSLAASKYDLTPFRSAWPEEDELEPVTVCAKTGLSASPDCEKTETSVKPAGIPLAICKSCGDAASAENLFRILSPIPTVYIAEREDGVELDLSPDEGVSWFVDGLYLGEKPASHIFVPGLHRVEAVRASDSAVDAVEFTVARKK
ncbi:MAG: transglycosylase domain-containing protein [Lentisphaeria bacterium]|nr:transglycosylase domain-containing protein [Lentisphaeria bacterium]